MVEWQNKSSDNRQNQQEMETEVMKYRNGELGVKVMTDDQMEMLRKQISVYATICERLVEMHKTISAQQDFAGMRLGSSYYDPLLSSAVHKIPSRQRWTPKPAQIQILEGIFEQCNGSPSRQKIKEITAELAQHGPISEPNVYHWFQNRRARSKRKQSAVVPTNGESEVETEIDSAKEKTEPGDIQPEENPALIINDMFILSPEIGIDQLIGKMEVPEGYDPYWQVDHCDLFG